MTVAIFVLAGIAIAAFVYSAMRGAPWRSDQLRSAFEHLLSSQAEHAFIQVRMKFADIPFLQLALEYIEPERLELALAFPDVRWSHEYVDSLREYAKQNDLQTKTSLQNDKAIPFLLVFFGNDTAAAESAARFVLHELFGISRNYSFRVMMRLP